MKSYRMINNRCRPKFNLSLWIIVLGVFHSFLLLGLGWCLSGHRFCCGLRCLTQCWPSPSELPPRRDARGSGTHTEVFSSPQRGRATEKEGSASIISGCVLQKVICISTWLENRSPQSGEDHWLNTTTQQLHTGAPEKSVSLKLKEKRWKTLD